MRSTVPFLRPWQRAPATPVDVLNPLRSEREAFRFLIYVIAVALAVVVVVLLLRAIL